MRYDLHIHSCLSPCADDDMAPATIAGMAKLNGIELIAVTDHNSARNLPAVQKACKAYGVRLLPGIEVNTAENIHMLAYFPTVGAALEMGQRLYGQLPAHPYDRTVWGRQLVMDAEDNVLEEVDKLLTGAADLTLAEAKALCESLDGIAVPAHVDRDSYSLLSVLGFAPQDLPFEAYELRRPDRLAALQATGQLPQGMEMLSSSDAHALVDISEYPLDLDEHSALWRLL